MAIVSNYILEYVKYKIAAAAEYYGYLSHTTFCLFSTATDCYQDGYNTFTFQVNSPPLFLPCNVVVLETIDYIQNEFRTINVWSSVNAKHETITWSVNDNDLIQIDYPIQVYSSVPVNTFIDIGFRIF